METDLPLEDNSDSFHAVITNPVILASICSYLSRRDLLNLCVVAVVDKQWRLLTTRYLWTSTLIKLSSRDVGRFLQFLEGNPEFATLKLKFDVTIEVTTADTDILLVVQQFYQLKDTFGQTAIESLSIGSTRYEFGIYKDYNFGFINDHVQFSTFCTSLRDISTGLKQLSMNVRALLQFDRCITKQGLAQHISGYFWPLEDAATGLMPHLKSVKVWSPTLPIASADLPRLHMIYGHIIRFLARNGQNLDNLDFDNGIPFSTRSPSYLLQALAESTFRNVKTFKLFLHDTQSVNLLHRFLIHNCPGLNSMELAFPSIRFLFRTILPELHGLQHFGVNYRYQGFPQSTLRGYSGPDTEHLLIENLDCLRLLFPSLESISLDTIILRHTAKNIIRRNGSVMPDGGWQLVIPHEGITRLTIKTTSDMPSFSDEHIVEYNVQLLSRLFPSMNKLIIMDSCVIGRQIQIEYVKIMLEHSHNLHELEIHNYIDDWICKLGKKYPEPLVNLQSLRQLKFPKPEPQIFNKFSSKRFVVDVEKISGFLPNVRKFDISPFYKLSPSPVPVPDRDLELCRLRTCLPHIEINGFY